MGNNKICITVIWRKSMIGEKLRNLRKNSGITQADLAKQIGLSPSAIGMYEQGRREPDSETLVKLAKKFKVSVDYLVGVEQTRKFEKIDELAKKIEKILRRKRKKSSKIEEFDDKTIEMIVNAVKEGIHQALKEE